MDENLVLADWLGRHAQVVVDRPAGSRHPEDPSLVYELNYGHVPGTLAPDGEPLDAYVIDVAEPMTQCDLEVIAIIRRRDDAEDKLVVRANAGRWTRDEIEVRTRFQERWFDSFVEVGGSGDAGR